jgi:hypothetical protein
MSDNDEIVWDIEEIPEEDLLYYRVHQDYIHKGELIPGVFKERGRGEEKGLSTDWSKYSTPEESLLRAKKPELNGIIRFIVRDVRKIPLEVIHAPIKEHLEPRLANNRAHTNVRGINERIEKDPEVRLKLLSLFKWQVEPPVELKRNSINF